jgi:hypothetical protein
MAGAIGHSSAGKRAHHEAREVCAHGARCAGKLRLI